jgi:hypothetical protein
MGCMSVVRAADGSVDHYYSLDWVNPLRKPRLWLAYHRNVVTHRRSLPAGRLWTECPNHPLPWRRPRRQHGDLHH